MEIISSQFDSRIPKFICKMIVIYRLYIFIPYLLLTNWLWFRWLSWRTKWKKGVHDEEWNWEIRKEVFPSRHRYPPISRPGHQRKSPGQKFPMYTTWHHYEAIAQTAHPEGLHFAQWGLSQSGGCVMLSRTLLTIVLVSVLTLLFILSVIYSPNDRFTPTLLGATCGLALHSIWT